MRKRDSKRRLARPQRYTVLAVGEGAREKAFLGYLKTLVAHRGNRHIKIDQAYGGSPQDALDRTSKLSAAPYAQYDAVFMLVDADRMSDVERDAIQCEAKRRHISLFVSEPCIEALFLALLYPEKDWRGWNADQLKRQFERRYLAGASGFRTEHFASIQGLSRQHLENACARRGETSCPSQWAFVLLDSLLEALFGELRRTDG